MNSLEELLELTEILEKESKDININDISQVISFLKKYIDCQNKTINAFKENYDKKTIELSKYKQVLDILKDKLDIKLEIYHNGGCTLNHKIISNCITSNDRCLQHLEIEQYEILKEVLGNE